MADTATAHDCDAKALHVPARDPPALTSGSSSLLIYPETEALPVDGRYRLRVNGRPVRVDHVILNPTTAAWGYRGPGAMAMFDFSGGIEVELEVADVSIESARVRPTSKGIATTVKGNVVRFCLQDPGQFFLEINRSRDYPFFLFASAPDPSPPNAGDERVIFFGPGVHDAGVIEVPSGHTLDLAAGAFVNGCILVKDATNVVVRGRGILHGGHYYHEMKAEHPEPAGHLPQPQRHPFIIQDSTNVVVEGITILDPFRWAIRPQRATNLLIDNVKIVGWRRNSDGIDPCNSQNLVIRNSFIKTQDDGISIKGTDERKTTTRNILVERMTMFSNWMRPFVVGGETRGATLERITFRDCDILHSGYNPKSQHARDAAMSAWIVDDGLIRDVVFEDIRVEDAHRLFRVGVIENQHSAGRPRGHIRNVTFRNVTVSEGDRPCSEFSGHDVTHDVRGIRIENVTIHAKPVRDADDLRLVVNEHVHEVEFVSTRSLAAKEKH